MKIKRRKNKKRTTKTEEPVSSYPEENNPFSEENGIAKNAEVLKGKKKKIIKPKEKESKRQKKLKGKRERAVSRAVLEHVTAEEINTSAIGSTQNPLGIAPSKLDVHTSAGFAKTSQNGDDVDNKDISEKENKPAMNTSTKTDDIITGDDGKPKEINATADNDETTKKKHKKTKSKKKAKDKKHGQDVKAVEADNEKNVIEKLENHTKLNSVSVQDGQQEMRMKTHATKFRDRGHSRRHRTSSMVVSSKERTKKKRLRLIKKLKRKKKDKHDIDETVEEQCEEVMDQKDYNPKSKKVNSNQINQLQRQVEEVKTVVSNQVTQTLEQRNSGLEQLAKSTEQLEKFAESFATVTHETRLKKQTEAKCCGAFSRHRMCWYICTCERGIQKKKKTRDKLSTKPSENAPLKSRAFADQADDNDAYEIQATPSPCTSRAKVRLRNRTNGQDKPSSARSSLHIPGHLGNTSKRSSANSSILAGIRNSKLLDNIKRASNPVVLTLRGLRTDTVVSQRKSSSTGDLHDLVQREARVSKATELGIREIAEGFDDENSRKRAAELLLLDHEG
ncbi:unnamed protein product [Clavelina lepadiformis]|uniref:V-SNARE coiled-coil homology domain-containing protein n=1 Tax=Clavelina lepadiformis TaxID=159417 RepID=A0ABP0F6G8_CLALP